MHDRNDNAQGQRRNYLSGLIARCTSTFPRNSPRRDYMQISRAPRLQCITVFARAKHTLAQLLNEHARACETLLDRIWLVDYAEKLLLLMLLLLLLLDTATK